ncbi:RNA polymerase sigma factor [Dysosmobacter sp.]|uniref:RNA polymerase sigma factor n=1 Tax=Dysosmobacter sp. TaxID=2591382 RepID=UPI002A9683EC|nr:sigma-70 family RNA polymerase sigma factor [Dysosmobacter sp.]MCI6055493.1 sigma-70 family RNA polymerase sigma factor [Dysosmobacter sp.]MDY5510583.1 sigma-70 family RNA polymerase sigma factor [Dysosmobacter sp.]
MTDAEFRLAVERYGDMLFRLAYSCTRSRADAEDVMQETLLKLYTAQKAFESPDHEKNWLVRMAVNECRHLLRTPWRRRTGPLEEAADTPVWDTPAQSELFRQVMALPPKYRAAIYLYYYEGYAVREIAALLGAKISTVQTWLLRARGQLKLRLKEAESQ